MGRNLTSLYISSSFQFLTQVSGSELQDGLGNKITGSLDITASRADNATSASYATNALSSSFAITASYALNAGAAVSTGSLLTTASAAGNVITFTKGDASTFNVTVATGSGTTTDTGSLLVTASAVNAVTTFTKGDGSTFSTTINNVANATSASYALTASYAANAGTTVDTGSLMKTGSVSLNTLTFTKGDGSTFNLTVNTGSAVTTPTGSLLTTASAAGNVLTFTKGDASTFNVTVATGSIPSTGSLLVTASSTNDTITYTKGDGTTFTNVINNVSASISASFANNATSASYALTASYAANVPAPVSTGSLLTTASAAGNVLTFTKGDASTFNVTVDTGSSSTPILIASGSQNILFADTASWGGGIESGYSPNQMIILGENAQYSGSGGYAVMFGGINNIARTQGGIMSSGSVMLGGINNTWIGNGESSFLIGGASNTLYRPYGFGQAYGGIIGGINNTTQYADGPNAGFVIVTGQANTGNGSYGGIFGGQNNTYQGSYGFMGGGNYNNMGGVNWSVILGGNQNQISYGENNGVIGSQYTNLRSRENVAAGCSNLSNGGSWNQHGRNGGFFGGCGPMSIPDLLIRFQGYLSNYYTQIIPTQYHDQPVILNDNNGTYYIGGFTNKGTFDGNSYGGFWANNTNLIYSGSTFATSVMNTLNSKVGGANMGSSFIANVSSSLLLDNERVFAFGLSSVTGSNMTGSVLLPNSGSRTYSNNYTLYGENADFRGSVVGDVKALSISSNTASLDCSKGNFFTVQLVPSADTYINPTNIQSGQTINIRVNTTGSGTVSFPSSVKQISGSFYVPTTTTGVDIVTLISFDTSSLYLNNVKNLV